MAHWWKFVGPVMGLCLLSACGGKGNTETPIPTEPNQVACTMEAKLCPDGSSVGRSGPRCEFAACPGASAAQ